MGDQLPVLIQKRESRHFHDALWKNIPFQDHVYIKVYSVRNLSVPVHSCYLKIKLRTKLDKSHIISNDVYSDVLSTDFELNEQVLLPWNEHTMLDQKLKISINHHGKVKAQKLGKLKIPFEDLDFYRKKRWVNLGDRSLDGELLMKIKKVHRKNLKKVVEYPSSDQLNFLIVEGRDLTAGISANPYIVIQYGSQECHTEVVSKGIDNPVWTGHLYNFRKESDQRYVYIKVFDSKFVSADDVLGTFKIKLRSENDGKVIEGWYNVKSKLGDSIGRLHVRFYQFCQTEPKEIDLQGVSVYTYNDFVDEMKTGDTVLFSGGAVLSDVIKHMANSPVSHIGYIIKLPDPNDHGKENLFIVESDQIEEGDYWRDEATDGINFNRLESRIHQYYGNMMLHCPLKEPLTEEQEQGLLEYVKGLVDSGAKFDVKQLLGVGMGIDQKEDLTDVFCSEFVAGGLKHIGLLEKSVNASQISPIEVANLPIFSPFHNLLRFQIHKEKMSHII
eukprot:TRINITY_DN9445_c0_g1_i1.p1 TRINITY_DN9445_c0_g1~~TRINITY_DN9445_c0_g1_i1.p1  ORF type:complete len:500 (-),score=108.17 TRINITY_DN9445_c0_g1_i1:22-1521(-)